MPDPAPTQVVTRPAPPFRLTARSSAVLAAVLGIIVLYATDQILPASTDRQAELRFWLAARATGVVAFALLTMQVLIGLVMSHPHNKATWKLSKRVFPWHDHIWVFVMAFLAAHVLSLVVDSKSGVDVLGAFIPGMSRYRSSPVALGTLALYAFVVTAVSARWTKLLPTGAWLSLHRLAALIFWLSWLHGVLAGTDTPALLAFYIVAAVLVIGVAAYRYWAARRGRPTFSTSRTEAIKP